MRFTATALVVLFVSLILALISRSPGFILKVAEFAGVKVESTVGLTSGMMPIFGPIVIYLLFLHFHAVLVETMILRRKILLRLKADSESPELELLKPPLLTLASKEQSRISRTSTYIWIWLFCAGPIVCYFILFIDFCFHLEFKDRPIEHGYQLFYTFSHWQGIWPTGHFGAPYPLPPVYPVWQPTLYLFFLVHLVFLGTDSRHVSATLNGRRFGGDRHGPLSSRVRRVISAGTRRHVPVAMLL